MDMSTYDQHEPDSTPKLALFKLPTCKPREPTPMLTPPLHPSVSVPFLWEEAPGKPRDEARAPPRVGPKVARCLELPPRLLLSDDVKMTETPSPTTVLDGPYVGRSLSLACTFSFRKGTVLGREAKSKRKVGSKRFGSGRWGSFREEGKVVDGGRGSSDFSTTLEEFLKSEKNVSITRIRRKKSFFSINSNFLADIYASFKQAVPWKRI